MNVKCYWARCSPVAKIPLAVHCDVQAAYKVLDLKHVANERVGRRVERDERSRESTFACYQVAPKLCDAFHRIRNTYSAAQNDSKALAEKARQLTTPPLVFDTTVYYPIYAIHKRHVTGCTHSAATAKQTLPHTDIPYSTKLRDSQAATAVRRKIYATGVSCFEESARALHF